MSKNIKSERELEQIQQKVWYGKEKLRVFIADIIPDCCPRESMDDRIIELENLVNTYWWLVVLKKIQKRWIPDYKTYIWSGKLDEIIEEMRIKWANLLIFGNILKPLQIYNINEKLKLIWAKAWDRVDLILKIFEKNAKTEESKLQIELASIKHMWPRIFGMWMQLSRQGWWTKLARWQWETNTEIMKRHLQKLEENIKKDLEKYTKVRQEHRKWRKNKGYFTVWIVWYTNAWKSSLLNILTWKWVLAEDKLFATLWTSVGKMWIENGFQIDKLTNWKLEQSEKWIKSSWKKIKDKVSNEDIISNNREFTYNKWVEILLNDTIWFIRDLPPELIKAFASTLEDSIESDLLLHVIDASDKKINEKIKVVEDILDSIWAKQKRIYVFNKIDLLSKKDLINIKKSFKSLMPVFVSTYEKIGLEDLKVKIIENLGK